MKISYLVIKLIKQICINLIWYIFSTIFAIFFIFSYFNFFKYSDYLLRSLQGPLRFDDPELVQYVKEKILEPPSKEPYNFTADHTMHKHNSEIFYRDFTKLFFGKKRNGFFIEAGALDGQTMSNTINLELKQGWTGLLVEPNPANYILLKRKHRKVWTANSCLSMDEFPKLEKLASSDMLQTRKNINDVRERAMDSVMKKYGGRKYDKTFYLKSYYVIQCIPLATLLLALNVTRVDLLSLDVEGVEEEVIRSFDFERFDIQVIYMEWWVQDKQRWVLHFMESKGYVFVANIFGDIIFAKSGSEYALMTEKNFPGRKFVYFETPKESTENNGPYYNRKK